MTKLESIPWTRIAAEGAAIVASILLAFWIQAWWDNKQARTDELVILSALVEELQFVQQTLEQLNTYHTAISDSATALLAAAVESNQSLSDEEIDRLLADIMWYTSTDWLITPELSSLASSGDLALVSNSQLRRKLGSLPFTLDGVRFAMQRDLDFYDEEFMPFILGNAFLEQIGQADDYRPGFPNIVLPESDKLKLAKKVSHRDLLKNQEFLNLLSQRLTTLYVAMEWNTIRIEDGGALLISIDEILEDTINLLKQEQE